MMKRVTKREGKVVDDGQKARKSSKKSEDPPSDDRNPPPKLPPEFKNQIMKLGFAQEVLLMQREMTEADVTNPPSYMLMPSENLDAVEFLTKQQEKRFQKRINTSITLFIAFLGKVMAKLKKPDARNYALCDWNHIVLKYKLSQGTQVQFWILKKDSSELALALVILDQDKVEELKQARKIKAEIKNRIEGYGGASEDSETVFVMEKILTKSDVQHFLTIPKSKIENDFLKDNEKQRLQNEGIYSVLIGLPSNALEYTLKLGKTDLFYLIGTEWKDFVLKYDLKEGMTMRLWSFRKPSSSSGSSLQLGFALICLEDV